MTSAYISRYPDSADASTDVSALLTQYLYAIAVSDDMDSSSSPVAINAVVLNSVMMTLTQQHRDRPLDIACAVVDTLIDELSDRWSVLIRLREITTADDDTYELDLLTPKTVSIDDTVRYMIEHLSLLYAQFDRIATTIGHNYDPKAIRTLFQRKCHRLIAHMNTLIGAWMHASQCDDSTSSLLPNDMDDTYMESLLTIIVIIHHIISLRIRSLPDTLIKRCPIDSIDTEQCVVRAIGAIPRLTERYVRWVHRLLNEQRSDVVMDSCVIIAYLDPDQLCELHCAHIVDRYTNTTVTGTSIEGAILTHLSAGVSPRLLWRAQQILVDVDRSHHHEQQYTAAAPLSATVTVQPLIVRRTVWDHLPNTHSGTCFFPNLPHAVQSELNRFDDYMKTGESHMLVRPIVECCWAIIEFCGRGDTLYNIKVTMFQLAVLAYFNDHQHGTVVDISTVAGLTVPRTCKLLNDLLRLKLLLRKPFINKSRDMHIHDLYAVNVNFHSVDRDFSIVVVDTGDDMPIVTDGMNSDALTYNPTPKFVPNTLWTLSELRRAIRADLRARAGYIEPATLSRSDLHLNMYRRFPGLTQPVFDRAVRKLITAGLVVKLSPGTLYTTSNNAGADAAPTPPSPSMYNGSMPGGPQDRADPKSLFLPDELRIALLPKNPSMTITASILQKICFAVSHTARSPTLTVPLMLKKWLPNLAQHPTHKQLLTALTTLSLGTTVIPYTAPDTERIRLIRL